MDSGPKRKPSLKERATKVKSQMKELKWSVLALYLARRDPAVPLKSKVVIAIAVGYVLSPIDLIPDFIPVLGYLDDIVIVPALIGYAIRSIPDAILEKYKALAREEFKEGTPKAWKAAILILLIWVLILALVFVWLLRLMT